MTQQTIYHSTGKDRILPAVEAREHGHPFFSLLSGDRPAVFAHRGGAGLRPENTLVAFEYAASLGCDGFELDVHLSADGEPVVCHDSALDRTTNGSGPVTARTVADLKMLDAGFHWCASEVPSRFPWRDCGVVIPTLREVFERWPDVPMIIEIKDDCAELATAVLRAVVDHRRAERTLIGSFHPRMLDWFRAATPRVATHLSSAEVVRFLMATWAQAERWTTPAAPAALIPPRHGFLPLTTPRFIAAARRCRLRVIPWTINDPQELRRHVALGVDGIITDRPDLLTEGR